MSVANNRAGGGETPDNSKTRKTGTCWRALPLKDFEKNLGVGGRALKQSKNIKVFGLSQKGKNELLAENKSFPSEEKQKIKKIRVVITAYSSDEGQTDDTPLITANGSLVKDGIVANNMLPFGTKIKIPSLYGNKVFTVTDRMNARKGNYTIDIWFPTAEEALNFGVKETYIEVSQM